MKHKPIRIDWEELESAFDTPPEELEYYLDLVTGQVVLEGEGEEGDFEDDDEIQDVNDVVAVARRPETTRLYVRPPDPDTELAWMEGFTAEVESADPGLARQLRTALDADGDAHDAFREVLRHAHEQRDQWFVYRSHRMHEAIDAWLDSHQVNAAEPPPWKR